jgi:hypothetical protein
LKTRQIQSDDLKVSRGWACSKGTVRHHISLKGASFVNKTFWLHPDRLADPETLAMVKRDLQALLNKKATCLEGYLRT